MTAVGIHSSIPYAQRYNSTKLMVHAIWALGRGYSEGKEDVSKVRNVGGFRIVRYPVLEITTTRCWVSM